MRHSNQSIEEPISAFGTAVQDVLTAVGCAATQLEESAATMTEVQVATADSGPVANEVLGAAKELMTRSEALRESVGGFPDGIKAA